MAGLPRARNLLAPGTLSLLTPLEGSPVPIRILLVEDEGLIRMVTAEGLEDEGYEVVEARDGDEAIELLNTRGPFNIVITDVRMPGSTDGVDLAGHARSLHPGIPLVVVSGYAEHLMTRLAAFDPAAVHLGKPCTLEAVVAVVRQLTGPG
jgi:CheY-like chemotaxis protein